MERVGRPSAPIGSKRLNAGGYVLIKTEQGWKLEHRVIMEEILGRPLRRGEQVHHLNEERADNDPENLHIVMARDHAIHHLAVRTGSVTMNPSRSKRCKDCGVTGRKKIKQGRCNRCRAKFLREQEDALWLAQKQRRERDDALWLAYQRRKNA